jgi:hypothetical protein
MRGFNEKLFGDKLVAGQLPTQLGLIGSEDIESLLLDFYPNAAAAYSVRKLRNAYTGNAIRVRRSSDNTEQDIGFVSNVLDTFALTSFCGASNGFVTTWYDQSGNGKNATQTTAINQPQIVSSGSVLLQNGKPSIDFDGTYDWMSASGVNISQPNTYFIVSKRDSITGGKRNLTDGITTRQEIAIQGTDSKYTLFAGSVIVSVNIGTTNQELSSVLFDAANSYYYVNNLLQTSGNTSSNAINNLGIGRDTDASDLLDGKYQELILYPSDQSSNRTGIENNINSFYSIY